MDPPPLSADAFLSENGTKVVSEDTDVLETISQSFPAFDHRSTIVQPFHNESKRDAEFQQKLADMLLDHVLEFHAWSSSRPVREGEQTAEGLENDINELLEAEKEQELIRQRLRDFVDRIKMALAALTGNNLSSSHIVSG